MKKLGIVLLMSLFLSVVGYGQSWVGGSGVLYVNPTSGEVAIGKTNANDKLDVNGTVRMTGFRLTTGVHNGYVLTSNSSGVGTWQPPRWKEGPGDDIYYIGDGTGLCNVGIGISSPQTLLHVAGYHVQDIGLMELRGANEAYMTLRSWSGSDAGFYFYDNQTKKWVVDYKNDGSRFRFYSSTINEEVMTLSNQGYVGIGTTDPQSKLAVNGTITTKEIEVQVGGWPDFIFEDNYKLMPLNKLEEYIKKEKSLPGIPINKEAIEEGIKLGEMQAKLLEKVEELTLYVIEQDKELTELKKEVGDLRKENKELRNKMSALAN
jgi:hypothetical protein